MISLEEIRKYLPKYLSADAQEDLFAELKTFPENMDQRLYTKALDGESNIFQGDGMKDLLFVNLPAKDVKTAPGMVISNTCDIDPDNRRFSPMQMVYTPILNLGKYKDALHKDHVQTGSLKPASINTHIHEIRNQRISHIFYLPKGGQLENDSIVFFDRLNHCPADVISGKQVQAGKIFTLSDYGYYLFLFKLSVHFTRIREGVQRSVAPASPLIMEETSHYGYPT